MHPLELMHVAFKFPYNLRTIIDIYQSFLEGFTGIDFIQAQSYVHLKGSNCFL